MRDAPQDVLDELSKREPIFHGEIWPTSSRAALEELVASDFWQVGASGQIYTRDVVLDSVTTRGEDPMDDEWRLSDFKCRQLSEDTYLLTYELWQWTRPTRRVTIWRREDSKWKVLYHQGTVVAVES